MPGARFDNLENGMTRDTPYECRYTARMTNRRHYFIIILFLAGVLSLNAMPRKEEAKPVTRMVLRADFDSVEKTTGKPVSDAERGAMLEETGVVVKNRITSMGGVKASVRREGTERIILDITGSADILRIQALVQGTGDLSLQIVDFDAAAKIKEYLKGSASSPFYAGGVVTDPALKRLIPEDEELLPLHTPTKDWSVLTVKKQALLNGRGILSAKVERDRLTGAPNINLKLSREAGESFFHATADNVNRPLAIIFNGRIVTWATIIEPIRDQVVITGFKKEEVPDVALVLNSGAFSVPLLIESEETIGGMKGK